MSRYILSRYTTPVSQSFSTLDDALQACLDDTPSDDIRSFIIDAMNDDGTRGKQYRASVAGTEITITIK